MGRKILLIEDDRYTSDFIRKGLEEEGHIVDHASDGRDGLFLASDKGYELVILDRMVPGMDGMAILKAMRAADVATPVIILSALGSLEDRISGLENGSDDYLVKPFSFSELLARANALMRRGNAAGGAGAETNLTVGDLHIDLLSRVVRRDGKDIDLKPREYSLLEYFARNADRVVTRTMLLEHVWNYHFDPATNVIDVHISRLRRKIDDDFGQPMLHTIRGAGYRLSAS
jgi:two-component system, OmpR family, response regulator